MIGRLRELVAGLLPQEASGEHGPTPELAAAVLLVEMARADHRLEAAEETAIREQLCDAFGLDRSGAAQLLEQARSTAEQSVSLHGFTHALHEALDYPEKLRIVDMLWRVALADKQLDKYEDYLVGKIADLLYVSRGDVIRLRHRAASDLLAGKAD